MTYPSTFLVDLARRRRRARAAPTPTGLPIPNLPRRPDPERTASPRPPAQRPWPPSDRPRFPEVLLPHDVTWPDDAPPPPSSTPSGSPESASPRRGRGPIPLRGSHLASGRADADRVGPGAEKFVQRSTSCSALPEGRLGGAGSGAAPQPSRPGRSKGPCGAWNIRPARRGRSTPPLRAASQRSGHHEPIAGSLTCHPAPRDGGTG